MSNRLGRSRPPIAPKQRRSDEVPPQAVVRRRRVTPRNSAARQAAVRHGEFLPDRLRFGPPPRDTQLIYPGSSGVFETAIVRGEDGPVGYCHRALDAVLWLAG